MNNNNNASESLAVNKDARNLDSTIITTTTTTTSKINRDLLADSDQQQEQQQRRQKKDTIKRNKSLLSFKSLDFHLKSIYSGLRNKNQSDTTGGRSNTSSSTTGGSVRKTPYLKVETVDNDKDESENLLLTYPQSPYQTRRSSFDKSCSQLLNITQYEMSRSQASSPYFLCPSPIVGPIRRSSTSDIMSKKPNSVTESRRPSTSDLLRRARERKGSEIGRLGRSISHGGLPRGGFRSAGRRTSMAF